jgi:hypothetical protein
VPTPNAPTKIHCSTVRHGHVVPRRPPLPWYIAAKFPVYALASMGLSIVVKDTSRFCCRILPGFTPRFEQLKVCRVSGSILLLAGPGVLFRQWRITARSGKTG